MPGPDSKIVDYGALDRLLEEGAGQRYRSAAPFPHTAIDNILCEDVARDAHAEIISGQAPLEKRNYSTFLKYRLSDPAKIGPHVGAVINELNSDRFIAFLEKLTGIEGLSADPTLEGGGIHRIGRGGFLKIHTDFNFHRLSKLYRRLNIIVYLNPDWQEEWGGDIELWDRPMKRQVAKYPPLWNRAVIFSTTDESHHGHPDPLDCPEGIFRNSIALYYYSEAAPPLAHHFEKSEMTNYLARPGESFGLVGRLVHALHQAEIKHPRLRRVTMALKAMIK